MNRENRHNYVLIVGFMLTAIAFQVAQVVMTALGMPADGTMIVVQAASIIILCLLVIGYERLVYDRRGELERWGDSLSRRHLLLDRREDYLNELNESLTWWKGMLL